MPAPRSTARLPADPGEPARSRTSEPNGKSPWERSQRLLLFVGADGNVPVEHAIRDVRHQLCYQQPFRRAIDAGDMMPRRLKKLVGGWVQPRFRQRLDGRLSNDDVGADNSMFVKGSSRH